MLLPLLEMSSPCQCPLILLGLQIQLKHYFFRKPLRKVSFRSNSNISVSGKTSLLVFMSLPYIFISFFFLVAGGIIWSLLVSPTPRQKHPSKWDMFYSISDTYHVLVFVLFCFDKEKMFYCSIQTLKHFFNWRIIALQCCFGFFCTTWISYAPPSWASLLPSFHPLGHHRALLSSLCYTATSH